jgi:hypothetical protein
MYETKFNVKNIKEVTIIIKRPLHQITYLILMYYYNLPLERNQRTR